MIENATLHITEPGGVKRVDKVKFKDNGWIAARVDESTWEYYPPHEIARIVHNE